MSKTAPHAAIEASIETHEVMTVVSCPDRAAAVKLAGRWVGESLKAAEKAEARRVLDVRGWYEIGGVRVSVALLTHDADR